MLALGQLGAVAAQDPPSAPPSPEDCRVAPRPLPLWNGTPAAERLPEQPDPSSGAPADTAVVRGVTATIVESIACANAGQPLRTLALFTDDFVARQFSGPDAADVVEAGALLSRPQDPISSLDVLTIVSISNVVVLDDGRVSAEVETADAEATYSDQLVLVEGSDGWLIDASFPLDGGATPAAGDA